MILRRLVTVARRFRVRKEQAESDAAAEARFVLSRVRELTKVMPAPPAADSSRQQDEPKHAEN